MLLLRVPGQRAPSHLPAAHSSGQPSPRGRVALSPASVLTWPPRLPVCVSSSLVRHLPLDLGTSHVTQDDLIPRSLMTSAKNLFLKKFTFTGSRDYDINILVCFFGGAGGSGGYYSTCYLSGEWDVGDLVALSNNFTVGLAENKSCVHETICWQFPCYRRVFWCAPHRRGRARETQFLPGPAEEGTPPGRVFQALLSSRLHDALLRQLQGGRATQFSATRLLPRGRGGIQTPAGPIPDRRVFPLHPRFRQRPFGQSLPAG